MKGFWIASLTLLLMAGCSSKQTIVVYSPHGPDVLRDYEEKFEAKYPNVDVQWLDLGSEDVYKRVRSEERRPVADIWWGGPQTMFMQAAEENLLGAYKPSWANAVPAEDHDGADRWYGVYRSPLCIMFNSNEYTRDQVPHTWDELLDPKWNQKITLRMPLPSGTMHTFIGAMILRQKDEEAGLEWLKKLDAATESYMPSPQALFDHIKRQPELISVWLMPDVPLQRERNGFPLDYYVPPQTPVIMEGIAIINNAPHRDLAEKFYEFVTSPDALAQQAKAYWKVPLRTDLDPATLPDWISAQKIDAMKIDWHNFAAHEQQWMADWEKEVHHGS